MNQYIHSNENEIKIYNDWVWARIGQIHYLGYTLLKWKQSGITKFVPDPPVLVSKSTYINKLVRAAHWFQIVTLLGPRVFFLQESIRNVIMDLNQPDFESFCKSLRLAVNSCQIEYSEEPLPHFGFQESYNLLTPLLAFQQTTLKEKEDYNCTTTVTLESAKEQLKKLLFTQLQ
jgi:hypothetical protein